jgi:multiple sugar transport system permease protein
LSAGNKPFIKLAVFLALLFWAFFCFFPIYWTIITSFKTSSEVYSATPLFLPFINFKPTLASWMKIFGTGSNAAAGGNFLSIARNSLIAAFGGGVGAVLLGGLGAYGLARFEYKKMSNKNISFMMISQRMLPPIALATPYFVIFSKLGMVDSLFTLILVYTSMNTPLLVWMLKDFFSAIPVEIEESALIDGCSALSVFWRIALPLALPGVLVAFLFAFCFSWNEFLFALTLTLGNATTLPVQIAGNISTSTTGTAYWDLAAQAVVVLFVPLLIAILVNRNIVSGLTLGAVK